MIAIVSATLISLGFLIANLLVLRINCKLYTEVLKDQTINRRVAAERAELAEQRATAVIPTRTTP